MIKITSLYKVYRSKRRKRVAALNNINLTLPDSGLVFVLGKSGSGKSTLLNLIGGLDKITSGTIEVDGNDISGLSEKEMCNYRNSHVGFIFQDYHLIEELTVYDNILLSLNLRRMHDHGDVSRALAKVGLAGYEHRYPSELSGGERQRIAIARAIIKKPRIILADEPTGNLDTETATSIIELLHEISLSHLILIVSHNKRDAHLYADRIIELSEGRIIDDYSRNLDMPIGITQSGYMLLYPEGRELSDMDINIINANPVKKVVKCRNQFLPTIQGYEEPTFVEIVKEKLSFFKKMRLSRKFLKSKALGIVFSSFMIAVIMVIMSFSQTIIAFDTSSVVATELQKSGQQSLFIAKHVDSDGVERWGRDYYSGVAAGDIQAIYDAGYKGTAYPVLNYAIPVTNRSVYLGYGGGVGLSYNLYMNEAFGTMVVDDAFMNNKFGEIAYAAKAEKEQPYGVYITDYLADAILLKSTSQRYRGKSYSALVGQYYYSSNTTPCAYINGIINTGYKERYAEVFELVAGKKDLTQIMVELYENPVFQEFNQEIYDTLGYCYATDPNFEQALANTYFTASLPHYHLTFNGKADIATFSNASECDVWYRQNVNDNECSLYSVFLYTQKAPEIPEGAKYIRVAFNDRVDDSYRIDHEVAVRDYALLRFDDNEPISEELMKFQKPAEDAKEGIGLDPNDGSVVNTGANGKGGSWISDYIEIPEGAKITEFAAIALRNYAYYAFYDENKECITTDRADGDELPDDSIVMNYDRYNQVFGTEYTPEDFDTFVPHKVTISHYDFRDLENETPLFTKEVTIIGLTQVSTVTLCASENIYELFRKDGIRAYGVYLDGAEGIGNVLSVTEKLGYQHMSYIIEGIYTMTRAVEVFIPIFEMVAIFLCVGAIFIMVNFSTRLIHTKMHEIGILKALGTQNNTIGTIFGLQIGLIAILTCFMSVVGYYFFIDAANGVLLDSLKRIAAHRIVLDLKFLIFQPDIAIQNCILIVILAILSLAFPLIKIKNIKPVKIIKTKE